MKTSELLVEQLRRTREWFLMLIEDLDEGDWTYQPAPGLQHALWICGHMATAQDTLVFQRCLNRSRLDAAFRGHFAIGGPIPSEGDHAWPEPTEVVRTLEDMQAATLQAIGGMTDAFLAEPAMGKDGARHPHYDTKLGAICHLNRHEAFHAGQLATLRRLLGKPFLR